MAEVDASIYSKLQAPANPLDMANNWAEYKNRLLENQRIQQGITEKQAVGQAAQVGIGPDGTIDPAAIAAAGARGNPLGAPGAIQESQRAAQNQVTIQQLRQDLQQKSYNYIGPTLAGMTANGNVDPVQWSKAITSGIQSQAITPEVGKDILQQITESEGDPARMREIAQSYMVRAQGPAGAVPSVQVTSGAGVPGITSPNAAIAAQGGGGPPAAAAGGAPAAPGAPPADPQRPHGIFIPAGESPPVAGADLPVGAMRSGLSDVEKNTQARITSELNAGADVGPRMTLLHTMDQFADKFSSGPAAGQIYNAVKTFDQLTGANVASEGATAYDVFAKTARQYAQSSGAQFNSSDFKALETIEANPNPEQTAAAIRQIVHKLEGVEDLKLARQQYFQKVAQIQDPAVRMYYTTLWDKNGNSPLPFQLERASDNPKEQAAIMRSLHGADKKTLMNQWTFLRGNGLIGGE